MSQTEQTETEQTETVQTGSDHTKTDQILTAAARAAADADTVAVLRLSLLDWLACGKAGVDEPVSRACRSFMASEGGAAQARLFGQGRVPARAAALVNGTTSHALDYDDTHFAHIGHPSVAVLSAALALGEAQGRGLAEILSAAAMGVEASVRFGLVLGRGHYQVGFHQTATAGAFGATVAATRILGLSDTETAHALGLVTTRASGLKAQFGTMGKPYNAGIAAANGVEAACLVAHGMRAAVDALEGPNGFLATHHGAGADIGPDAPLFPQVSHKFHACCHGLHAALEALASLPLPDAGAVTEVVVTTHPRWLTVCNIAAPETGLELKFSYRGILAAALLGEDTAALGTYRTALCGDPALVALRDRVRVVADDTLTETEALVQVDTGQGSYEAHHDLNAPLPLETRAQKVMTKAAALVGADTAEALWQAIVAEDLSAVTELM